MSENISMQVAVHGSYFSNNFGDTLLVRMACDWIAQRIGRENVFLAVQGNAAEQEFIGYPVIEEDRRNLVSHLVFAGGGYFGEPKFGLLKKFRWQRRNRKTHLDWLAAHPHAKKAIFGVGVGPLTFPSHRRAVRRLFFDADPIYVRDQESLAYAKEYGLNAERVGLGVDLALSIRRAVTEPERSFSLHATGLRPGEIDAIYDALSKCRMIKPDQPIDILFDGPASKKSVNRYKKTLEGRHGSGRLNFIEYSNVDALIAQISKYDLVFTSKLHVGIVATALGRKVISMPVHQKTVRFYRQIGLEEFCLVGDRRNSAEIARMISRRDQYRFEREPIDRVLQEMQISLDEFLN